MSGVIYVIVLCLCNEAWGISGVICVFVPCLRNDVWGMSAVFFCYPVFKLHYINTEQ
jgi:hypothetical protein